MVTISQFRALSLPGAEEEAHFGEADFRAQNRLREPLLASWRLLAPAKLVAARQADTGRAGKRGRR